MLRLPLRATHDLAAPTHPPLAAWIGLAALLAMPIVSATMPGESTQPALVAPDTNAAPPTIRSQRCLECHRWEESLTHPTGVSPTMKVPSHLPLEDGKLVCTTCHIATEHRSRGSGPMLRAAASESLCADCHTGGKSRREMHGSGLEKAHLSTRRSAAALPAAAFGRLDTESETCMTCHDGTTATDVGSHNLSGSLSFDGSREHPLAVRYQDNRSGGRDIRVVEPSRLDRRIRLFGQSIGCGSCHSPYSKHRDLLVIENERSRLCLTCHQQ